MLKLVILEIFVVGLCVFGVQSFGNGAPMKACDNLEPIHPGVRARTTNSPYQIEVTDQTYTPGKPVRVRIFGSQSFQGLMVQARIVDTRTPVGSFSNWSRGTKGTRCTNSDDSWTHSNDNGKRDVTVMWNPPRTSAGSIQFIATVARDYNNFWPGHRSRVLKYKSETVTQPSTKATTNEVQDNKPQDNVKTTPPTGAGCINRIVVVTILSFLFLIKLLL